jgi:hypothetical protein
MLNGHPSPEYVIEINVMPFKGSVEFLFPMEIDMNESGNDPNDEDSLDTMLKLQLPNVYEDEEHRCYYRQQAGSIPYSLEEIRKIVRAKARNYYQPILDRLEKQRSRLQQEILRQSWKVNELPEQFGKE